MYVNDGYASPTTRNISYGSNTTFTIYPNTGYHISYVTCTSGTPSYTPNVSAVTTVTDKRITRTVSIKKANVGLLREDSALTNINNAAYYVDPVAYNTYEALVSTSKTIKFGTNAEISVPFEKEDYQGFNSVRCVIKGYEWEVTGKNYKSFDNWINEVI